MTSIVQYLREIYYDPDSDVSYSDIKTLWNRVKKDRAHTHTKHERIKYQHLKKWLTEQRTYTLHKALHKSFPTRKTYVPNIDNQFQADIVDIQSFERDNEGYRYILTVKTYSQDTPGQYLLNQREVTMLETRLKPYSERGS